MTREEMVGVLVRLGRLAGDERARVIRRLPPPLVRALEEEWFWKAHGGQEEPEGDWRVWLIRAGRGFGKTRAGAEWVWARAREHEDARIALVGATIDEVAKVMIEGESGLLAIARTDEIARWWPSLGRLDFPSGARAFAYSGEKPGKLKGPQHHFAWCDELAKWGRARETWDNLMLGLRLGDKPRTVVTTTPQPGTLLAKIEGLRRTHVTRGRTAENAHLPEDFRTAMMELYGGTRLGRQELDGVLFADVAGALWTRELMETCRVAPHPNSSPEGEGLVRVVVGVDPPASAEGTCGIVACGIDERGVAYVLGDHSVGGASPQGWAARVAGAAAAWGADRVIAEANNGGNMVGEVLAAADVALPVKLVSASRGKAARAEPIASRFEAGKAKLAGSFPALEDELAGLVAGGGYEGPGTSPDRADAMVWAMTELFRLQSGPRVRGL